MQIAHVSRLFNDVVLNMKTNKQLVFIASFITISIVALSIYAAAGTQRDVATPLSGNAFVQKYSETAGAALIDVRSPAEYDSGHVAGALNINVEDSSFATKIASLDRSKPYFLYCHSGRRSDIAATIMRRAGFTHVYELSGGLSANAQLPLTTSAL